MQRAMERARDNIDLSFSSMGRYAGGAHNEALGRGLLDAQLGQINTARGQLGTAYQNALAPSETLMGAGGARDAYAQSQLQDTARQFYEKQQTPFDDVAQRNAILTGAGQLGGSTYGQAVNKVPLGNQLLGYGAQGVGAAVGK